MHMGVDPRRGVVDGVVSFGSRQVTRRWRWPLPILTAVAAAALLAGCDIVPLPDATLLKQQPPPKCDAKSRSATQKQAASATDADGDAAKLRQLDYEAQCYRHAEMIARSRLGRLQELVQGMVRAAKPAPSAVP